MLNLVGNSILIIFILGSLYGCSINNADYPANDVHLKDITLTGQGNSNQLLIFKDNTLTIKNNHVKISPDMDPSDSEVKESTEETYQDITIKTVDDMYLISNSDGLSMTLKRIGERIISDEEDNRYSVNVSFD